MDLPTPPVLTLAQTGEPVLLWRFPEPRAVLSSAAVGGGAGLRDWLLNIEVDKAYSRTDLAAHVAEVATGFGLSGPGVGLLTAARIERYGMAIEDGLAVHATVGLSEPTWAAAPPSSPASGPGTINIVIEVAARLSDAAMVNVVMTATEAKTQALVEAGVPGTGTASDAVAVCCAPDGPAEAFGGPRSSWGSRVARAVHRAVAERIEP